LALQAGASVVGLQSFTGDLFTNCQFHVLLILVLTCLLQNTSMIDLFLFIVGDTYLFYCSGTIVEFFEESTMIVTVPNLVSPDGLELADNLKVGSIFLL
jgi:hypothetical protein